MVRAMLPDCCLSCVSCLSVCGVGVLWPNGWMDQYETWHAGRTGSLPHCVRWEPRRPSPKRGRSPQFSAHICCGQMAEWIKMPLGRKVGLSPSDIVLDGDPAPLPQKATQPPQLSAHIYCGQTDGWIEMPLGTEVGLGPATLC